MFEQVVTVIALIAILILVFAASAARRGGERAGRQRRLAARGIVCLLLALFFLAAFFGRMGSGRSPSRSRTTAIHRALISGLENYRSEFGEFPQPVRKGRTLKLDGQIYQVDSALMLYQAMTADGNDSIVKEGNDKPSDGRLDNDLSAKPVLTDMPKEMWSRTEAGFIIVDAFGHPFQYEPAAPGKVDVVNKTYDLWSFGGASPVRATKQVKEDASVTIKWIKNF